VGGVRVAGTSLACGGLLEPTAKEEFFFEKKNQKTCDY
jgi:hypothetical protein